MTTILSPVFFGGDSSVLTYLVEGAAPRSRGLPLLLRLPGTAPAKLVDATS